MLKRAVAVLIFVHVLAAGTRAQVAVNSATTVLIDPSEPTAVQKAAGDLVSDMEKVFGAPVHVAHRPTDGKPVTIWIGQQGSLPTAVTKPSGWEVLRLQTVRNPWPGSPIQNAIVLTGSDVRGTIYAVYQFSQEFLGVDPLYWWTDHQPAKKTQVVVSNAL